ncbi:hypothetical protein evm_000056 [Chilo suppressalis]|nr:hypothetical protein evm_000056 [Chilo suppressalis]
MLDKLFKRRESHNPNHNVKSKHIHRPTAAPIIVSDGSVERLKGNPPGEHAAPVEELYFNNWPKSDPSVIGKPVDRECKQSNEVKSCVCGSNNVGARPYNNDEVRSMPPCKIMQSGHIHTAYATLQDHAGEAIAIEDSTSDLKDLASFQ